MKLKHNHFNGEKLQNEINILKHTHTYIYIGIILVFPQKELSFGIVSLKSRQKV